MSETTVQVKDFIDKCDNLRAGKFIMATSHIRSMLISIASSKTLYELFDEVTKNFDYIAAKQRCFTVYGDGFNQKFSIRLPDNPGDVLAFVFCLLVEFDRGSINFSDFLQRYFSEDGSYSSAFRSFCTAVILPFEKIIADLFEKSDTDGGKEANKGDAEAARKLAAISVLLNAERTLISGSAMNEADKNDGISMLDGLENAIRSGRNGEAEAILRGYDYYSACHGNFSDLMSKLANVAEE